jgi:hypothetical protein
MREIADGLGSGVTPEQIQTSIDLGNEWLAMMKENDFSQNREKPTQPTIQCPTQTLTQLPKTTLSPSQLPSPQAHSNT